MIGPDVSGPAGIIPSVGGLDGSVATWVSNDLPSPLTHLAALGGALSEPKVVVAGLVLALMLSCAARRWATAPALRLAGRRGSRLFAVALIAGVLSLVLCVGLKIVIGRARPYAAAPLDPFLYEPGSLTEAFQSMPSAQAALAAALVIPMIVAAPRALSAWSILMVWLAMSRVLVADHWLSDVIAGLGLGAAVALITEGVFLRRDRRLTDDRRRTARTRKEGFPGLADPPKTDRAISPEPD